MTSISSATRAATDMAATRRGCVHATPFLLNRTLTHSKHHCGICKQPGCKLQLPWLAFLIIVHSISLKLWSIRKRSNTQESLLSKFLLALHNIQSLALFKWVKSQGLIFFKIQVYDFSDIYTYTHTYCCSFLSLLRKTTLALSIAELSEWCIHYNKTRT